MIGFVSSDDGTDCEYSCGEMGEWDIYSKIDDVKSNVNNRHKMFERSICDSTNIRLKVLTVCSYEYIYMCCEGLFSNKIGVM